MGKLQVDYNVVDSRIQGSQTIRVIACLDVRTNNRGDLVVTKGDQYDVREHTKENEIMGNLRLSTRRFANVAGQDRKEQLRADFTSLWKSGFMKPLMRTNNLGAIPVHPHDLPNKTKLGFLEAYEPLWTAS
ncbi:hypothetical protein QJS04_geneDACA022957 [Acorus gramineus]|uniref:Uncharacterized protein n=1 Tax=Acorus gramineus TaxID=55184 RepID=A0AAV9BUV7_ACOGR|nr:hypothetical protein QJS04_geneDACA022957 [Acorus gramineus]